MRTRVEKCPGGVAVIVPESLAALAGLRDGESADLELAGGRLVVRAGGPVTLAELLAGVTPENLHGGVGRRAARRGGTAASRRPPALPDRGHPVWLSLDPQSGHEQAGRRPALVLSPASYNGPVGLARSAR